MLIGTHTLIHGNQMPYSTVIDLHVSITRFLLNIALKLNSETEAYAVLPGRRVCPDVAN